MPWSSGALRAIGVEHINALDPATILDVGAGAGTWQTWWRRGEWTAVEIWEPYIERFGLADRYARVLLGDARALDLGGPYDLAICGDVLEHVECPLSLFQRIRTVARQLLVQVPVGVWPQGPEEGNPYEAHVVTLTRAEVEQWPGVRHVYEQDGIVLLVADGLIPPTERRGE